MRSAEMKYRDVGDQHAEAASQTMHVGSRNYPYSLQLFFHICTNFRLNSQKSYLVNILINKLLQLCSYISQARRNRCVESIGFYTSQPIMASAQEAEQIILELNGGYKYVRTKNIIAQQLTEE
jgi:hypothetical protein